jgi:hypothetical protein
VDVSRAKYYLVASIVALRSVTVPRPKKKPQQRIRTWQIVRLKSSPAAFVGLVDAPNKARALEAAVKTFAVRPQDRKRLIALPHR